MEMIELYRHAVCIALCLLSLGTATPTFAFNSGVQARDIRRTVEGREYRRSGALLDEFAKAEPKLFELNNYDYLRARVAERAGDFDTAKKFYLATMARPAAAGFVPFCLRHLATVARRENDFKTEQKYLLRLSNEFSTSTAARGSRLRLAESYAESGSFDAAIAQYRQLALQSREIESQLGLLLRKAGREAEAIAVFRKLLPGKDDASLLAAEQLDERGDTDLTEAQRLVRARLYLTNRRSAGAIRHFSELVEKFPASKTRAEAMWSIGRAYYIDEQWDRAAEWYDRVHAEYPSTPDGEKGFYQAGHALQNAGKYKEAVARYEAFIAAYPNSEYVGGAHLNAIDTLRIAGDDKSALDWCTRTENALPTDIAAVTAKFQRVKIFLSAKRYREALAALDVLQAQSLGRRGPGTTNAVEAQFLRAFTLEKLERYGEAIELFLGFPDTRDSFYGQRATDRLISLLKNPKAKSLIDQRYSRLETQAKSAAAGTNYESAKNAAQQALRLTDDAKKRSELFELLGNCYRNIPAYARAWGQSAPTLGRAFIAEAKDAPATRTMADELCFLGLYDEAVPLLGVNAGGPFGQAVWANRGSQGAKAIAYGEATFGTLPTDFRLEVMPRDVAELLYPAPYRDALAEVARPRRVDPRILLAIARQESRFNPLAKSAVAARGMFQFIDSTADRIAKELNLTSYERSDLYDPEIAAKFGAQYVADLFKEFTNHPPAVAASYNGGESAVRRWMQRAGKEDVDRFPCEVGYAETKDYVFKVIANYRAYQQLYDIDLRPTAN